jgi:hypothetical protein
VNAAHAHDTTFRRFRLSEVHRVSLRPRHPLGWRPSCHSALLERRQLCSANVWRAGGVHRGRHPDFDRWSNARCGGSRVDDVVRPSHTPTSRTSTRSLGSFRRRRPLPRRLHRGRGRVIEPPTRCANGHPLGPRQVLVGHEACLGHGGGHTTWTCRTCGHTEYGPPTDAHCTTLNGPAASRVSFHD